MCATRMTAFGCSYINFTPEHDDINCYIQLYA